MKIYKIFFVVSRLFIAVFILYFIFSNIPITEVISITKSSRLDYILISLVLYITVLLFTAYRLKTIAYNQNISITIFQAAEINLSKIFYGLLLPGGSLTGGTIRFYKLFGKDRNTAGSLATISLDGVISIIALCLVAVFIWLLHMPPNSGVIVSILLLILTACISLILLLFKGKRTVLFDIISDLINKTFFPDKLKRLVTSLSQYKNLNLRCFTTIFAVSIATQLLGILVYYFFARSLGIDITLVAIGWVRGVVVIATMLPITLSGIGVREGVFLYMLNQYGVASEQSLALSFLVFVFIVLISASIYGIIEVWRLFLSSLRDA